MPGDPSRVYASMGNYVFSTRTLLDLLKADAKAPGSHHDFGMDILPKLAGNTPIYAYNFETNRIPGTGQPILLCQQPRKRNSAAPPAPAASKPRDHAHRGQCFFFWLTLVM